VFVIGPEDFIVNKLARLDRRSQDERDAASVLARQADRIDWKYLRKRTKAAGVGDVFGEIIRRVEAARS
jgi:hypothetical protein